MSNISDMTIHVRVMIGNRAWSPWRFRALLWCAWVLGLRGGVVEVVE